MSTRWTDNQAQLDQHIAALAALTQRLVREKTESSKLQADLTAWLQRLGAVASRLPAGPDQVEVEDVAAAIRTRLDDGPPGPGSVQQ